MTTQRVYALGDPPDLPPGDLCLGRRKDTHTIFIAVPSEAEIWRRRSEREYWGDVKYDISKSYYAHQKSDIDRIMTIKGKYFDLYTAEIQDRLRLSFGSCSTNLSTLYLWGKRVDLHRVALIQPVNDPDRLPIGIGSFRRINLPGSYHYESSDSARYMDYWRGIGDFMTDSEAELYKEKIAKKSASAKAVERPPVVTVPRHGRRPLSLPRNLRSSRKGITTHRLESAYKAFKTESRICLVN